MIPITKHLKCVLEAVGVFVGLLGNAAHSVVPVLC